MKTSICSKCDHSQTRPAEAGATSKDTNIVTAGRYRAYADAVSVSEIEMAGRMNTMVVITDDAGRLTATVWAGMPAR